MLPELFCMAATAQVVVPYLEYCQHSNSRHDMMTRTPGPDLQHHILGCDNLPDRQVGGNLHTAVRSHEVLVEEVAVGVVSHGLCWPVWTFHFNNNLLNGIFAPPLRASLTRMQPLGWVWSAGRG